MGTLKNLRKKMPSIVFVDDPKAKKDIGPGGWWSRRTGGNVRCDNCGLWMAEASLPGHQVRKHNFDNGPMKPSLQRDRPPPNPKKKTKTETPPPRPATKKTETSGENMSANTTPIANTFTNPATYGSGESVVEIFNQWAERLPKNYLATRREAETMGESMRGVADALRRRAHNMVDVIGVHPSTVEPYEEAAAQISQAGDAFMEVANRIEAKYRQHIEVINDRDTPNLNYLDEDGER